MSKHKINRTQLENILKWSEGEEISIPHAKKQAIINFISKNNVVPLHQLEKLFGPLSTKQKQAVEEYLRRTKWIPPKLLLLLRTRATARNEIMDALKLPPEEVQHILSILQDYGLIRKISEYTALSYYFSTMKSYSLRKFESRILPILRKEGITLQSLKDNVLYVWKNPKTTYIHAVKMAGHKAYIEYANHAAEKYAEQHKDLPCITDIIRLKFGLTPKIITFHDFKYRATHATLDEAAFEDKFREFLEKIIHKINPKAECEKPETGPEDIVHPDILIHTPNKNVVIELKRATRGYYIDTSLKQFLRYLNHYKYVGIVDFYEYPGFVSVLENKTYRASELMDALKAYLRDKTVLLKQQVKEFGKITFDDPTVCEKLSLQNTYLAYRYITKRLDKIKLQKEKIQVIIGEQGLDVLKDTFPGENVWFFLAKPDLEKLANKYKVKKDLQALEDFDKKTVRSK